MKKIFTAIGSILMLRGSKGKVPVKKETTKVTAQQTGKSKSFPGISKTAAKVVNKKMLKIDGVEGESIKKSPKIENKAIIKRGADSKAIHKVENKAHKVENKPMIKIGSHPEPKIENKTVPKVKPKRGH